MLQSMEWKAGLTSRGSLPAAGAGASRYGPTVLRFVSALLAGVRRRARSRRTIADLDARLLRDVGLEPFDLYYGWKGPRQDRADRNTAPTRAILPEL
jgi:hypothetical protein